MQKTVGFLAVFLALSGGPALAEDQTAIVASFKQFCVSDLEQLNSTSGKEHATVRSDKSELGLVKADGSPCLGKDVSATLDERLSGTSRMKSRS
jgi:hypothetical protein